MNRPALKLSYALLLGFAIGRLPMWDSGAESEGGRPGKITQSGSGELHGGGPAGAGGGAGTGKPGGKPSQERVEMLAASFRQKYRQGNEMALAAGVGAETAGLAVDEFGPLLALLVRDRAPDDPDQADMAQRTVELLAVRWAMLDPKTALAFVMDQPEIKDNTPLIASIVQELARKDLPAARVALDRMNNHGQRQETTAAVVSVLQLKDPQAALAFAREFENPTAETEVLRHMALDDPMGAAAQLTPGREDQGPAVSQIANSLLKRDRGAFEAWCAGLRDPIQRGAARLCALTLDAGTDPKGAAQAVAAWLAAEPEAGEQISYRDVSGRIVQGWVDTGAPPAEVAAWAAGLPAGPFQDEAVLEACRVWVNQDMMAASAWTASLPEGTGRDSAIFSLAVGISNGSPAEAFEWARTVGNPSMRYNILMHTLFGWVDKDPAAAQAAVQTLPAGDQGYLTEVLQKQMETKLGRPFYIYPQAGLSPAKPPAANPGS